MQVLELLFVPTIIFVTVVAPLWIVMHYLSVRRASKSLSREEREHLEHMLATVDTLVDRIQALEAILDVDHPDWRGQRKARDKSAEDFQGND